MRLVYNTFTNNLDYVDSSILPGYVIQLTGDLGTGTTASTVKISTLSYGGTFKTFASASSVEFNAIDGNLNLLFLPGLSSLPVGFTGSGNILFSSFGNTGLTFTDASSNNGIGGGLFQSLTTGSSNQGLGISAFTSLTTGNFNVGIGDSVGSNYTSSESSNILLNNLGTPGESNTLRIGAGTGTDDQMLSEAFISGINGNTIVSPVMVVIDPTTDQLGTQSIPVPGLITWTDEAISFNALVNNGYFTTGTLTVTLPASPTQGQFVVIYVDSALITTIQANTGQFIRISNQITSVSAGTISSTKQGDCLSLVYRSASSTWNSTYTTGNWNLS